MLLSMLNSKNKGGFFQKNEIKKIIFFWAVLSKLQIALTMKMHSHISGKK